MKCLIVWRATTVMATAIAQNSVAQNTDGLDIDGQSGLQKEKKKMSDKQKLLEWLEYCNDEMSLEDIINGYIIIRWQDFSASRLNDFLMKLNVRMASAINVSEMANRVAHERATYLKCYLEGNMYASEEVARQCVDLQIENAKVILERTEGVAL